MNCGNCCCCCTFLCSPQPLLLPMPGGMNWLQALVGCGPVRHTQLVSNPSGTCVVPFTATKVLRSRPRQPQPGPTTAPSTSHPHHDAVPRAAGWREAALAAAWPGLGAAAGLRGVPVEAGPLVWRSH